MAAGSRRVYCKGGVYYSKLDKSMIVILRSICGKVRSELLLWQGSLLVEEEYNIVYWVLGRYSGSRWRRRGPTTVHGSLDSSTSWTAVEGGCAAVLVVATTTDRHIHRTSAAGGIVHFATQKLIICNLEALPAYGWWYCSAISLGRAPWIEAELFGMNNKL